MTVFAGIARFGGHIATGYRFDGNSRLQSAADLTGISDGKDGTISFWLRMETGNVKFNRVLTNDAGVQIATRRSDHRLYVELQDSGGTPVLTISTTQAITQAAGWYHILASWDGSATTSHLYVNGEDDKTDVAHTTADIDYTGTAWAVGNDVGGGGANVLKGQLADVWFDTTYIDLSVEANRLLFRTQGGGPRCMGGGGEGPTGTRPLLFLAGEFSDWHTNKGTGGGFTQFGSFADPLDHPEPANASLTVAGVVTARAEFLPVSSFSASGEHIIRSTATFAGTGAYVPVDVALFRRAAAVAGASTFSASGTLTTTDVTLGTAAFGGASAFSGTAFDPGNERLNYSQVGTSTDTSSTSYSDLTDASITFTPVANKAYLVLVRQRININTGGTGGGLRLIDVTDSNAVLNEIIQQGNASAQMHQPLFWIHPASATPVPQTYKLQGRATDSGFTVTFQALRLDVLELGNNDFTESDETNSSTTNTAYQTKLTMTESFSAGQWLVLASGEIDIGGVIEAAYARLTFDGGGTLQEVEHSNNTVGAEYAAWFGMHAFTGDGTSKAIVAQYRSGAGSTTASFRRVRMAAIRLADFVESYTSVKNSQEVITDSNTDFVTFDSISPTLLGGNYLVLSRQSIGDSLSSTNGTIGQLTDDDTGILLQGVERGEAATADRRTSTGGAIIGSYGVGAQAFTIKWSKTAAAAYSAYCSYSSLAVINLLTTTSDTLTAGGVSSFSATRGGLIRARSVTFSGTGAQRLGDDDGNILVDDAGNEIIVPEIAFYAEGTPLASHAAAFTGTSTIDFGQSNEIFVRTARFGADRVDLVAFDGTNDYLTRGADLTGNADGKVGCGSLWVSFSGGDGVLQEIYIGATPAPFRVRKLVTNQITVQGRNGAGDVIVSLTSNSTITAASGTLHIAWWYDLANTTGGLFINGVQDEASATFTDDTINYTESDHFIGINASNSGKLNGCLGQVYINFAEFIDLSVSANLEKFFNNGPVSLGSDGSTPTGTAPIMFFDGDLTSWHTNKGTGGGFTENGALTDCGFKAFSNSSSFTATEIQLQTYAGTAAFTGTSGFTAPTSGVKVHLGVSWSPRSHTAGGPGGKAGRRRAHFGGQSWTQDSWGDLAAEPRIERRIPSKPKKKGRKRKRRKDYLPAFTVVFEQPTPVLSRLLAPLPPSPETELAEAARRAYQDFSTGSAERMRQAQAEAAFNRQWEDAQAAAREQHQRLAQAERERFEAEAEAERQRQAEQEAFIADRNARMRAEEEMILQFVRGLE